MTPKRFAEFIVWDNTVNLIGFPDDVHASMLMLGIIRSAALAGHVKPIEEGRWGPDMGRATFQFDYLGFRYELEGVYKNNGISVDALEKIARVDEPDEFSDTFGDQDTYIIEDYRLARQPPEFGSW